MKHFIKFFSYTIILVSIATMVSGCSNKKAATTTKRAFVIWSFEDEDIWKPTIASLKKKLGTAANVVYVKKTLSPTYENDALNSLLSSQGPDIWAMPNNWIYRHKAKLTSMPDALAKDLKIDEQFVPAIKESCQLDGKIYALSPYMDTIRIYYNQKMMQAELNAYYAANDGVKRATPAEKEAYTKERARVGNLLTAPPLVWSDLAESVKMLTKKNGATITQSGLAFGTAGNVSISTDILYALMIQNGTKMTSDDLKIATFGLPEETSITTENSPAKRAVDFYTSFANPASANYSWNATMPNDVDAFAQGKVAMIAGYGEMQNYLRQNYPNFQYKTSVLPQIGDNPTNVTDYGSFNAFAVPITSPYNSLAWTAVKEISLKSDFAGSAHLNTSLKKKNFEATLATRTSSAAGVSNQPQTAHSWAKGRYPAEIDKIFKSLIDKTNGEPAKSQSFIDSASIQATDLLKKTEW